MVKGMLCLSAILGEPEIDVSSFGPYNDLLYPNSTLQAALLVQRDISLDVPISHILLPGINLTSSWFWTKQYTVENISAITDLFSMGYRRFELDLWWNNATASFQLCPEQIVTNTTTNSTHVMTTTFTQETATILSTSTSFFNVTVTRTIMASPTPSATALNLTEPILLPNNYTCAPGADFQAVLDTITSILIGTDNQLKLAGLFILVLNLHTLPLLSSNSSTDLSVPFQQSLSDQINTTLGDWLYTPQELTSERQNVNASFLADTANPIIDIPAYYQLIFNNVTGTASTPNGWPSTRHLFEIQGRRLLIGFGSIDMSPMTYDISQDTSIIFPPATFGGQDQLIPSSSIADNSESCIGPQGVVFGASGMEDFNSTSPTGNKTFALSEDPSPSNAPSYASLQGIVNCGLSPLIDSPLQNTNSGSLSPYTPIAGTVWSWLPPTEPQNTSLPVNGTDNVFACAALLADSGRWVVLECNTQLNIACRANSSLYNVLFPP
jgi:hypothetical protein